MSKSYPSLAAALEAHTIPEALTGCWLCWAGLAGGNGYARLKVNGKTRTAHRLSWRVHKGPIPNGLSVLHRCDTRACVNPDHLFLGTYLDNHRDMAGKRRRARFNGARNGRAKLLPADIAVIRSDNRLQREIAADYGVDQTTISAIKTGRSWSVPDTCG